MEHKILRNNLKCPIIGFGTWQIGVGKEATEVVNNAINVGYRFFDTAYSYGNEFFVGKALNGCGIGREELFIQGKVWNDCLTSEEVYNSCLKSLKMMKLNYFDSYLIHWPYRGENQDEINYHRWIGMERLLDEGFVKSIGVCNYEIEDFENLKLHNVKCMPMINQIEFHPGINNNLLISFCNENDIVLQAWSPLGHGEILKNEILKHIAQKNNVSIAQLCLFYDLKKGFIVIPKSSNIQRMSENLDVFSVNLRDEDFSVMENIK